MKWYITYKTVKGITYFTHELRSVKVKPEGVEIVDTNHGIEPIKMTDYIEHYYCSAVQRKFTKDVVKRLKELNLVKITQHYSVGTEINVYTDNRKPCKFCKVLTANYFQCDDCWSSASKHQDTQDLAGFGEKVRAFDLRKIDPNYNSANAKAINLRSSKEYKEYLENSSLLIEQLKRG